jgi:sulfite exporter TauE/SafE
VNAPLVAGLGLGLGLANALHCAAMCGPLALQAQRGAGAGGLGLYWVGKSLSYGFLGALAGSALGVLRGPWVPKLQAGLGILTAALLLWSAWRVVYPKKARVGPTGPVLTLYRNLGAAVSAWPRHHRSLGLGVLSGLLPCGVLGLAFIQAAGTGSALLGTLSMVAFGLGTLPALAAVSLLGGRLTAILKPKAARLLLIALLVLIGGITLVRAGAGLAAPAGLESSSCCH